MYAIEKKITELDEYHADLVQEKYDGNKMSYAWSFISYGTPEEFAPLLARAKHWCYIHHNQDDGEAHYHILARFPTEMSLSACRKHQSGTQNLLGKMLKSLTAQMKMTAYLTHDTEKARNAGKHVYNLDDVVYKPHDDYWLKQFDKEGDKEDKEAANENFVNDLLAPDLSVKDMAIKYGRDFIKNFNSYMAFRAMFIPSRQLTELEIHEREVRRERELNDTQLELEGMAEDPTRDELYNEVQQIKVDNASKAKALVEIIIKKHKEKEQCLK